MPDAGRSKNMDYAPIGRAASLAAQPPMSSRNARPISAPLTTTAPTGHRIARHISQ